METFREIEHHRTWRDRLISDILKTYFALSEPLRLRLARRHWEQTMQHPAKKQNPLVTIIIPTYYRGKLLAEQCLPPILAQTYKNIEVLVIGDGRIDNTRELVASIGDPRLCFIDEPEYTHYPKETKSRWFVGGVPARNKGLAS